MRSSCGPTETKTDPEAAPSTSSVARSGKALDAGSVYSAPSKQKYPKLRLNQRRQWPKTVAALISEQQRPQAVPDPAITHARGRNHPDANPAWRAPAIHSLHQPVIAPIDVSPEVA